MEAAISVSAKKSRTQEVQKRANRRHLIVSEAYSFGLWTDSLTKSLTDSRRNVQKVTGSDAQVALHEIASRLGHDVAPILSPCLFEIRGGYAAAAVILDCVGHKLFIQFLCRRST